MIFVAGRISGQRKTYPVNPQGLFTSFLETELFKGSTSGICKTAFIHTMHLTSHLTSFHLSGSECDVKRLDHCGCNQSDETAWPTSFWLVAAMAYWIASLCTQFRWN